MEPLSTATLAALTKVAAPMLGRFASAWGMKRSVRFRVAWVTRREARTRNIKLGYFKLARWLGSNETQALMREHTEASLGEAARQLSCLATASDAMNENVGLEMIQVLIHAFLSAYSPSDAVAFANAWQTAQVKQESTKIRQAINEVHRDIADRLDSETFDVHLRSLPPPSLDAAQVLRSQWPPFTKVVAALASQQQRGAFLEEWSRNLPEWVGQAPDAVFSWLGFVAADYGKPKAAVSFYEKAIVAGAFPRAYWETIAAITRLNYNEEVGKGELDRLSGDHPLAAMHSAALGDDWERAWEFINAWDAQTARDVIMKGIAKAEILYRRQGINAAINAAVDVWELTRASGAAMLAARWFLVRATRGGSTNRFVDTEQALNLALKARNARRIWLGDSVEAALLAAKAAALSENFDLAWRLTQQPPEGEALPGEANNVNLQAEAAVTAAITGRVERSRELLTEVTNPYTHAVVHAILEEGTTGGSQEERHARIQDSWRQTWQSAGSDEERLQAAAGLALSGVSLPDLSALRDSHRERIEELETVSKVIAESSGDLARLRANVNRSRILAVWLAEKYIEEGEVHRAADALRDAAERWKDPRLMLMAAQKFRDAGDTQSARTAASSSLTLGGPKWAGAGRVYELIIEIEAGLGRWDEAENVARQLISIDTGNLSAHWALVQCLVRRGQLEDAWQALTISGTPFDPRTRDEALLWVMLYGRYATDPHFVKAALDLVGRWSDDEELLAAFLGTLYTSLRREELTPAEGDLDALHAATADYIEKYPQSAFFRIVEMGPEDNPLEPFEDDLRRQYERMEEVVSKVRRGEWPLPVIAFAANRTFTEVSLMRGAGFVLVTNPSMDALDALDFAATRDSKVVIDPTVAHSVALLDEQTAAMILGTPSRVMTTDEFYRDALQARDTLGARSTMSIVWDPRLQRGGVSTISEEDAIRLAERSQAMLQVLDGLSRVPWPELRHFKDLAAMMWLNGLDLAKERGWVYWSDDVALRQLARHAGVRTFSTLTIIDYLRQSGLISRVDRTVARAQLIRNYYVDVDPGIDELELAASSDAWEAKAAAAILTRPLTWRRPKGIAEFVLKALSRVSGDPYQVEQWMGSTSVGLVKAAPSGDDASKNLRVFLSQTLSQSWLGPVQFRAAVQGIRSGLREREDAIDPVADVLRGLYGSLVRNGNHSRAATLLMSLVSSAEPADQSLAARIILTYRDDG